MKQNICEPIAIVGSSCRLPGQCNSPSKLWKMLKQPADLLVDIPISRFNTAKFYHVNGERSGSTNVTKAYLLRDDETLSFDHDFFNISAREAESMDPQQRIVLEVVYESLESAGYSIEALRGSKTSVFVGQMSDDYHATVLRDIDTHPRHTGTGVARSILANRVSYFFDWTGASMTIDTACSSSLVALHQAVQSLRSGESTMAVVVGSNLIIGPETFSYLSSLNMLSPNGRCHMWDIRANGYARGEGFVAMVLKTVTTALNDKDTIESVIRNTGVNQDGHSDGLTVPNPKSQAELIRSTYARCGLDCTKETDRCQLFEAHGTGTAAGDPKEAEAIEFAFFKQNNSSGKDLVLGDDQIRRKMFVTSIKTVMGHTEGTAGLVSLLKASLAVRHKQIPPNMHFSQVHPSVAPFYRHLEVPTDLKPWPVLAPGVPRRASVNSFGFGGTNAHAIVESFEPELLVPKTLPVTFLCGPFVVSGHSKQTLIMAIKALSLHIKSNPDIDLTRLAWTLQQKRSQFVYRASFTAQNVTELVQALDSAVEVPDLFASLPKSLSLPKVHVLGVFTGQGAQWAGMGSGLYLNSALFKNTIDELEAILGTIPHRSDWSLKEELLRDSDPLEILSRPNVSQPLCTALQIALVDLLHGCGIRFGAVVGHSSGEIAAAYAAGIINKRDAILIAFYRGHHCMPLLTEKPNLGAMMAVGMSPEDAEELCQQVRFRGRISIAAYNSGSSVTLSGDAQYIREAQRILKDRSVLNKVLKVDMAYHSHHMLSISAAYLESLQKSQIQPTRESFNGNCNWYSSVYSSQSGSSPTRVSNGFQHRYWVENMVKPVRFSDALSRALATESFNMVLEVGPHSALKGPVTDIVYASASRDIPYHCVLHRGVNALNSFSDLIGAVWTKFGSQANFLSFCKMHKSHNENWTEPRMYKNLPGYSWEHAQLMLKESTKSKLWRTNSTFPHELLGVPTVIVANQVVQWRSVLRMANADWLPGHRFQNQVIVPAAGYVMMTIKALLHSSINSEPVDLIELEDFDIKKAITLDASSAVDLNLEIRVISRDSGWVKVQFSCWERVSNDSLTATDNVIFSGMGVIELSSIAEKPLLPGRSTSSLPMDSVAPDQFYPWIAETGLQYSGPFVLESIQRRLNCASVISRNLETDQYPIHPATLDSMFQGLFAAFAYPKDGRLWTTYLPKSLDRFVINLREISRNKSQSDRQVTADCHVTEGSASVLRGDLDIFNGSTAEAIVQIKGLTLNALEVPSSSNDQKLFWKSVERKDIWPCSESAAITKPSPVEILLQTACERVAYFYFRQFCRETELELKHGRISSLQYLVEWLRDAVFPIAERGQSRTYNPSWESDTFETIAQICTESYSASIDLELLSSFCTKALNTPRGSLSAISEGLTSHDLDRLQSDGLGFNHVYSHLGNILDDIAFRYPRLNILEVNAGIHCTTSAALQCLRSSFQSYTVASPSEVYLADARGQLQHEGGCLYFQTLQIEQCPLQQGFQANSYDVIIAPFQIGSAKSTSQAIKNCRTLLRPGGFLVLLEVTNPSNPRLPLTHSQWWQGVVYGRKRIPVVTEVQWDTLLCDNGFSGIDRVHRDFDDQNLHSMSVILTQAVDDYVYALRDPLDNARSFVAIDHLLIIGGSTLIGEKMAKRLQKTLQPFSQRISRFATIEAATKSAFKPGNAVICLTALEQSEYVAVTPSKLRAIQTLFGSPAHILWLSQEGAQGTNADTYMMIGIGRTAMREVSGLRVQFVDIKNLSSHTSSLESQLCAEMLLRSICSSMESHKRVLWSHEAEVTINNGVMYIHRILADMEFNQHFNANRRILTKPVSLATSSVEVNMVNARALLTETDMKIPCDSTPSKTVQFVASSASAFVFAESDEHFHISIGNTGKEQEAVVAFTPKVTNNAVVPNQRSMPFTGSVSSKALSTILTVIQFQSILPVHKGVVWIHNANLSSQTLLQQIARRQNTSLFFTTAKAVVQGGQHTVFIHPRTPSHQLASILPSDIEAYVDLGGEDAVQSRAITEYAKSLNCKYSFDFSAQVITLPYSIAQFLAVIKSACDTIDWHEPDWQSLATAAIHKADALSTGKLYAGSIYCWEDIAKIHAQIIPPVQSQTFSSNKTYLLVGLTGEVGVSLCFWMARQGAKYIAVGSRKPTVDQAVIAELLKLGTTVRVFSLDVTNMESLKSAYKQITSTMPAIGGVANGALVVQDHLFENVTIDDLNAVFRPKIIGSQNLDKLFFDTPLDFFILFSSALVMIGRPGQSMYNASNMLMTTVALRRRQRGLSASVMHFGMLVGFGHLHTDNSNIEARLRQDGIEPVSEPDFHAIFAQAIVSGKHDSGLQPEVISGLGTKSNPEWLATPRFWHLREATEEINKNKALSGDSSKYHDLLAYIMSAENRDVALNRLIEGVGTLIKSALGSSEGNLDTSSALVSLGLDSVFAVDIRTKIQKELEISIPLLKLLDGSSLEDLCSYILDTFPSLCDSEQSDDTGELSDASTQSWQVLAIDPISKDSDYVNKNEIALETPPTDREESTVSTSVYQSDQVVQIHEHAEVFERTGHMSHAQSQLFFLDQVLDYNAYNIAYYGIFKGMLDVAKLKRAVNLVATRHESLRSAYFADPSTGQPIIGVSREPQIIFECEDRHGGEVPREVDLASTKDFKFSIEKGVVMKVTVISQSNILHSIQFSYHHIVLDGFGWSTFINDVAAVYSARTAIGDMAPVSQCIDLAEHQLQLLTSQNLESDLLYWKGVFGTVPKPLPLFTFAKRVFRPDSIGYNVGVASHKMPTSFTTRVNNSSLALGATSFHFYLASVATFLRRCLDLDDVVIGVVDTNRNYAEHSKATGYFLNMLPVRIDLSESETFDRIVRDSRNAALEAMEHSSPPLSYIVDSVMDTKVSGHHPLFQVAINYQQGNLGKTSFGDGEEIQWTSAVPGGHPYDLLFNIAVTPQETYISIISQRSLYEDSDGALLLSWYINAIEALAISPDTKVLHCPVASKDDISHAIIAGRGPEATWPHETKLTKRIEDIATSAPSDIAIQDDFGESMTYKEMIFRAKQIQQRVESACSTSSSPIRVAMLLDPTADAICSMLGILHSDMTLVPLDTLNHPQRLRDIVEEVAPNVLICHDSTEILATQICSDLCATLTINISEITDMESSTHSTQVSEDERCFEVTESEAIILYTSGSTGKPKGIRLTHRGLVNQVLGTMSHLNLQREITLQQSPLGFDLALDQIFLALCGGGKVVVAGVNSRGDPLQLSRLIAEYSVTLTHFVPSEYLALTNFGRENLRNATSWTYAMSGGEKLDQEVLQAFAKLDLVGLNLVNVYGPAEITIACARGIIPYHNGKWADRSSDCLYVSPNYGIEIVDEELNVLPLGFPGEICITGPGVGLGYLARQEESRRKFISRKVATDKSSHECVTRFYRSGDRGRLLPDGSLQILGRLDGDTQVKINGFRIELGEIGDTIVRTSGGQIASAVVSLRHSSTSHLLVAFVVFDLRFTGDKSEFIQRLKTTLPLPQIMQPHTIVPVDKIPVTANGKTDMVAIDRLPMTSAAALSKLSSADRSLTISEQRIRKLWEDALPNDFASESCYRVVFGPETDFFEAGGNSILMITVKTMIERDFGVSVSMRALFQASTLGNMAVLVENALNTQRSLHFNLISDSLTKVSSSLKQPAIDWDAEVSNAASGLKFLQGSTDLARQPRRGSDIQVLLTGATGFVGRHILSHLIDDARVSKIHCISIRAGSAKKLENLVRRSNKIQQYAGDLSAFRLGLSDEQFSFMVENIDAIIHNGSDVSLLKTYQSLRNPNVLSTRALCEMALPRGIPIHYISTASVAKVVDLGRDECLGESPASPANHRLLDAVDGYAASKWASEALLERVTADTGLPTFVHRLAHVLGDDASELDAAGMLIKYSILLRALPLIDTQDVVGKWDFVDVSDVAETVLQSTVQSVTKGKQTDEAVFINHCSIDKVENEELKQYLQDRFEVELEEVDRGDWLARAKAKGLAPLVYEFLSGMDLGHKWTLPLISRS